MSYTEDFKEQNRIRELEKRLINNITEMDMRKKQK